MKTRIIPYCLTILLIFALILTTFWSCSKNNEDPADPAPVATDYSQATHWLSVPVTEKAVDIFYLYPTAWRKTNQDDLNICAVDDPQMLKGAASAYQRQATAFETVGNVYAPFYRQADANWALNLPQDQKDSVIGSIPTLDATAAFDFYLNHFNKGRPFILAGHSQGSNVLLFLLSGYLKQHPEVYSRMIAAYIIGNPVTQNYLTANPHLKFAMGPDDTGVIISYNTQSPAVPPGGNLVVSNLIGLVINPITWTRETTPATTSQGLGSFMPDSAGHFTKVPQYADARIDPTQGVLICTTAVDSNLILVFGPGVFHSYDYPFYYYNLQENALRRTNKFLGKNE
ncbi:MAG TPA: DUF3089 domain-containing protein [Bacteroidales bacterium]|nr:DUF3089 domain-containing protein [Bacteroidales bacterium]HPS50483.1 DUF3089 domain-containing protein [Bacteroidales bacterium]